MNAKINIGIVGARGIVGGELFSILRNHPNANIKFLFTGDKKSVHKPYISDNPKFANMTDLNYSDEKWVNRFSRHLDILFLAGKDESADMEMVKKIGDKCKIITIGGAYRLKNTEVFEKTYGVKHTDPDGLARAVYGMPELAGQRDKIRNADLIANPGCYATAVTLALAPFDMTNRMRKSTVVAISGKTGSGLSLKAEGLFNNANENVRAYGLGNTHKHFTEVNQNLDLFRHQWDFTPLAGPYERGLMAVCYVPVGSSRSDWPDFHGYYKDSPFVNIYKKGVPELKPTAGTNRVDIGYEQNDITQTMTVICVIDNLVKGAAGQAVQNMNLMMGLKETAGLIGGRKIR